MTVYLLHFHAPIAPGKHTTQHYCGSADDLERRIKEHRAGRGARLTEVAKERGVAFSVARTWEGGRAEERRIKSWHNGKKLCPICASIEAGDPGDVNFYAAKRGRKAAK